MDLLGLDTIAFKANMESVMKKVGALVAHASNVHVHGNSLSHNTLYIDLLAKDDGRIVLLEVNSGGQNLRHIHHNGITETVCTEDLHKFHRAVLWKGAAPETA